MALKGVEKAALLLLAVSEETAGKVFAGLEEDEIKELSQVMASLGTVDSEVLEKLVKEFYSEINVATSFVGNMRNTEKLLRKVMGQERVEVILEEIRGPAGKNIWDKMANINEEILVNYLKNEYPQTAALILSRLDPKQSAKVLSLFSEDFAFEVMKRMLTMDSVKKEVLERVEKTLRSEFISTLTKTQKYDNNQIMAEIFNSFDRNSESKFMEMLEDYDNEMADNVKGLMFVFNDIRKLDAPSIQSVLKLADKNKLALALKGANEDIRKLFLDNMSQRAAKILAEEIESMGPVKLKDVDEAQAEIINIIKELMAKGDIEISEGGENDQIIY
jgi:flagellar motor switch protein FliG